MPTSEHALSRDALLALSALARLSARPDLPVGIRIAVGLCRTVLVDLRAHVSCYIADPRPRTVEEDLAAALTCLRRDAWMRGRAGSRSRAAADVLLDMTLRSSRTG
jgi:hypothetical protein